MMHNEMVQVKQSLKRHETEIKVLRGTSYDGTVIWRIHPISLLFLEDAAKKDLPDTHYSGRDIYSLPFYSGQYGYRYNLGATINPRKGTMALFLMLHRGDYDALLPWPLEFQSMVTIIPPTGSATNPIILDMESRAMKSPQHFVPITYRYSHTPSLEQLVKYAAQDVIYVRGVVEEVEVYDSLSDTGGEL
eukprot:Em0001g1284a